MAYEVKPNSGSLFKNEDKQTETQADYKGSLNVDGVDYFLDAWINQAASGRKYMSVRVKRKDKQPEAAAPVPAPPARAPQRQAPKTGFDDMDVPF